MRETLCVVVQGHSESSTRVYNGVQKDTTNTSYAWGCYYKAI